MCEDHTPNKNKDFSKNKKRHGASLEHGKEAHQNDHQKWSRRDFLHFTGIATAGSLMLGNMPVQTLSSSPVLKLLGGLETDRTLVIIRMDGGNDGLNTVIRRGDSEYYNVRPTIAVPDDTYGMYFLDDDFGLNSAMSQWAAPWMDGKLAIVHNVGYPSQNFSHFRSSDIWASASDSDEELTTGWVGRFLDQEFPAYSIAPPSAPAGLQIGVQTNFLFSAPDINMALAVSNVDEFYRIAQTGQLYDTSSLTDCSYGNEAAYMRTIANNSFIYSDALKAAYDSAVNTETYPDNELGQKLAIVARLIKGRLGTKVYMVSIGGFDTHANQNDDFWHPSLLQEIADSTRAFLDDVGAISEVADNTLVMTISEFGRTVAENGSFGTDHGSAAPLFLMGNNITGGLKGTYAGLDNLDTYGDLKYTTDFRSIYATILEDWFCVEPVVVDAVMGQNIGRLADTLPACAALPGSSDTAVLLGHNPDPTNSNVVLLKYAILKRGVVRMQLLDTAGKVLTTFFNTTQNAGSYNFPFNRQQMGIPPGEYIYRVDTGGKIYNRRILLF